MRRLWLIAFALAGPSPGQEPAMPETKLTLRAAAAPVPALRYKLLPDLRETTPGNAVQLYYRAFAPEWSSTVRGDKALMEKIDAATTLPAADVKADAALAFLRESYMLKEIDRAARRSYCDWELVPRIREDGIRLLLPDVQTMREFARFLAVRTRLQLADRDFDAAAYTLQTMLGLGRHVADAPTLIQALVGVAIDGVTFNQFEEWIRTPDSPNLYWALAALPRPFVDMRKPYEGERVFIDQLFPGFRDGLAKRTMDPLPPAAFERFRRDLMSPDTGLDKAGLLFMTAKKYVPAKKALVERGWDAKVVEALPVRQVVLLVEVAEYDRWYDDMTKWLSSPYTVARPALTALDQRLKGWLAENGPPGLSIAGLLLPATMNVQFAATRTDRRIAALMAIEALRLHAAEAGEWPNALADIKVVPVLPDPVTGVAFQYERQGDTATLTLVPPAGERPYTNNSHKYTLTLSK